MSRYFHIFLLGLVCAAICSCVSPPRGWSTKLEAERTIRQNLPAGSSKAQVVEILRRDNIKYNEITALAQRPNSITAVITIERSWPVPKDLVVAFVFDADGKLDRSEVHESLTGP